MFRKCHRRAIAIFVIVMCPLLLNACSSSSRSQYLAAAQLILQQESVLALWERLSEAYDTQQWIVKEDGAAEVADELFPNWARDDYAVCVHWQQSFTRAVYNLTRQPGEPQIFQRDGSAEGWILIGRNLESHILELTIEYNGESILWIDAWDDPSS